MLREGTQLPRVRAGIGAGPGAQGSCSFPLGHCVVSWTSPVLEAFPCLRLCLPACRLEWLRTCSLSSELLGPGPGLGGYRGQGQTCRWDRKRLHQGMQRPLGFSPGS